MTIFPHFFARARRGLVVVLATVVVVAGWSDVALAHTDFESSDPADQQTIVGPIDTVTVTFTNPATPSGDGFQLLDPSGTVRTPTAIDSGDGTVFVLRFDPPLGAGTYGVRWKVQAGDAHPIEGTFRFDVEIPVATTTAAVNPPVTTAPAAAAPVASTTAPSVAVIATDEPKASAPRESLDDFLASDSSPEGAVPVGRFGRTLTFAGTIFGVGALAALAWVIRGRRDELRSVISWIRLAGLVVAVGGIVELAGLQASQSLPVRDLIDTKAGFASVLRVVGGITVWFGFHERAGHLIAPAQSVSAAVATDLPSQRPTSATTDPQREHRWSPTASAGLGLTGLALILASYWFNGHTVSKGPWAVHSLLNFVHVGAASVWGGGVFAMTMVAWLRRRHADPTSMAAMVIRFSILATISLTAVIGAGLTMTILILDTPGDLFATEWGRILLVKTLAVTVAAAMGAYNHFRLRPALEASPNDPSLARQIRTTLTIESVVFASVVVLTAWLVASAT